MTIGHYSFAGRFFYIFSLFGLSLGLTVSNPHLYSYDETQCSWGDLVARGQRGFLWVNGFLMARCNNVCETWFIRFVVLKQTIQASLERQWMSPLTRRLKM
ncbi:uncharacterized protein LOC103929330 [Pyrus x bretschneideri]|uniref:uncharacterized protein LOC103929330 n=1 Tax=Pyrus x bretschneideri TaxID=225117 RepID=UPI00202E1CA2|nr:uncharacterized protein LOC103929330 [Pyrus x bretschneideri]